MSFDLDKFLGREKIPSKYVGLTYDEWNDYDRQRYQKLTEKEKIEMGYWVELQSVRNGANMGFMFGIVVGFVLTCAFLSFFR